LWLFDIIDKGKITKIKNYALLNLKKPSIDKCHIAQSVASEKNINSLNINLSFAKKENIII